MKSRRLSIDVELESDEAQKYIADYTRKALGVLGEVAQVQINVMQGVSKRKLKRLTRPMPAPECAGTCDRRPRSKSRRKK